MAVLFSLLAVWPWITHLMFLRVCALVYKMGVMTQLTHWVISRLDETTHVKCQAHRRLSDTDFSSLSPASLNSLWEPERAELELTEVPVGWISVAVQAECCWSVRSGTVTLGIRPAPSRWWWQSWRLWSFSFWMGSHPFYWKISVSNSKQSDNLAFNSMEPIKGWKKTHQDSALRSRGKHSGKASGFSSCQSH